MGIIGKLSCSECGSPIYIEESSIGSEVRCSRCGQEYTVSAEEADQPKPGATRRAPAGDTHVPPRIPAPLDESPRYKQCPYCSERILHGARKCKHCGEYLDPALRRSLDSGRLEETPVPVRPARDRGLFIILALFLGGLMGVHNFYAGRYARGGWQLTVFILCAAWFAFWEYQWRSAGFLRIFLGPNPAWIAGWGLLFNATWVLIDVFVVDTDGRGNPMV